MLPFILQQTGFSATPLLVAGIGELTAERAGIINIGIEGTMLAGAAAAYSAAVIFNSPCAGLAAAIIAGILMAILFAIPAIWFRADQIVTGTAINILAIGLTTTIARLVQQYSSRQNLTGEAPHFDPLSANALSHFSPALTQIFQQYALLYLAIPAALLLHFLLERTRTGLIIRALGDNPNAADSAGIRVRLARTAVLLFAGSLSGLAGAYLSTMRNHTFQPNMTAGQGFLVLALVIFARWNMLSFLTATAAFSLLGALQSYLTTAGTPIPRQLFDMLPYAATLLALTLLAKPNTHTIAPIHLARPWPENR